MAILMSPVVGLISAVLDWITGGTGSVSRVTLAILNNAVMLVLSSHVHQFSMFKLP